MTTRKPDPMTSMLNKRRAAQPRAYADPEFEALMAEFKQLQDQLSAKQQLIETLEQNSAADAVTGLANRRTLESELQRSLATARRYGRRHALLVIDINDFSSINTRLGTDTGDAVLCHIARIIRQNIRPTDIAARTEADNFAVVLNELRAIENAEMRGAEILAAINHTPCVGAQHTVHVTANLGVCVFGADDELPDILQRADTSMAAQKRKASM